jgi:DNA-binding NtrC family response regulator
MSEPETVAEAQGLEEVRFRSYVLTPAPGAAVAFDRRLIYVGSAPDNDLVLDGPTVSRTHARLEFDGSGYLLRDLESKNGTSVQGIRVREAYLPPRATLRFGAAEVAFTIADAEVEVALATGDRFGRLLGRSSQMREVFGLLARVAKRDVTVLVEGESGTGKELVAEAIHTHSPRAKGPLVVFDCSAVAPDLIESELFGHVKGAFTGAVQNRDGVFAQADGGTLFIDEVGELPLELQPKLLRVLESREVRPVGGSKRVPVNVRVVAATNRQLDKEVDGHQFREDLYYRLAVIKVRLPALRQRPEDIPFLVQHFLEEAGAGEVQVSFDTMRKLEKHRWTGNVRELKNYVERAVVLSDQGRLETRHLSSRGVEGKPAEETAGAEGTFAVDYELPFKDAKGRLLDRFERHYWLRLLERTGGNISEAARIGGIHRKSLEYLMKKLELRGGGEKPP